MNKRERCIVCNVLRKTSDMRLIHINVYYKNSYKNTNRIKKIENAYICKVCDKRIYGKTKIIRIVEGIYNNI